MKKIIFLSIIVFLLLVSCENKENVFPDFDYTTVYFPYQTPVRTIELGKDYIVDNSGDNAHNFKIFATMGGVYVNKKEVSINVVVDNSLPTNVKFGNSAGALVLPMPSNYYELDPSNKIVIKPGDMSSGISVHLTDAFFADPLSLRNTYVIPLRMTDVVNADSILRGKTSMTNPNPLKPSNWVTVPKDYVLFAVKYINAWHGNYLRRGRDVATGSGLDTTMLYHKKYVENDQVVSMTSLSLNAVKLSLTTRNKGNLTNLPFDLQLNVDNNGRINVTTVANTTPTYTVSGSGEYVTDGDMWGGIKRDVMHLNYTVNFGPTVHSFTDTIVLRDRGIKFETFTPFVF
ncbi:MAG TPA: DUF5627 domain-containing protein [Bacteroidales bacterium]|nr:DUF5627 domain-containing protein [Bacteroidales bacterium]